MTGPLAQYDSQLRGEAELHGAVHVRRAGPLWIASFAGDDLFVTYRELDDPSARVDDLVALATNEPSIRHAEWKTRAHDDAPGLEDALSSTGFLPDPAESVMLGEAAGLVDVEPPAGVTMRNLTAVEDMQAALEMQDRVLGGDPKADQMLTAIRTQQANGTPVELWAAYFDGQIVCSGRIDPIPGTTFAGIWGGATLPEYRGRGIYRALTAARVRSAMAHGVRWIHSDSTAASRPILERAGLVKVTETVPWVWRRPET